ncbi:hypothetical protein B5808_14830 [Cnuibacter physcomitrellae]|uniref:Uncharacterized protein n=1 Tax=Cnuibacter physcomitrellae TaxID=1619308 RepID=A0A1X9LMB4_9MICO|nr:hypothetical protein [Cnuibacter physcomitrellae]ARJ06345.1 hypothetical protein B5808_14830 [Cnuibacter physcomitrellae]
MKRIHIGYDGVLYTAGARDYEALKRTVEEAHRTGTVTWITVNHGEGRPQPVELLIAPGIPVALHPVVEDEPDDAGSDDARSDDAGPEAAG